MGWTLLGQDPGKYRPSKGKKKPTLKPIKNSNTKKVGRFTVSNNFKKNTKQIGRFTVPSDWERHPASRLAEHRTKQIGRFTVDF